MEIAVRSKFLKKTTYFKNTHTSLIKFPPLLIKNCFMFVCNISNQLLAPRFIFHSTHNKLVHCLNIGVTQAELCTYASKYYTQNGLNGKGRFEGTSRKVYYPNILLNGKKNSRTITYTQENSSIQRNNEADEQHQPRNNAGHFRLTG